MQRGFGSFFPEGIPTSIPLLPEYLRKEGYKNHNFGKWHLGFCSERYTPTARGFDTFDGLYIGVKKYEELNSTLDIERMNTHQLIKHVQRKTIEKIESQNEDQILTNFSLKKKRTRPSVITAKHYLAKVEDVLDNHNISDPFFLYLSFFTKYYNKYKEVSAVIDKAKVIKNMDDAIGDIVDLLKESGQYNNTIILFMSDNGGRKMPKDGPSPNYPLRGYKGSVYEGGTKVPAFIHSPLLTNTGYR